MITVLAGHAARLITFRHNGNGLNTASVALVGTVVAITGAMAFLRWGLPMQASGHAVLVGMLCYFSRRVGVGYALLSSAIDATAMAVWFMPNEAFTVWEASALAWLGVRVGIEKARAEN